MPSSTAMNFSAKANDSHANARTNTCEVWQNLKDAIANSSGFQRWLLERQLKNNPVSGNSENIEQLVRAYLRETLETLAY